jgi:hypothetical protein
MSINDFVIAMIRLQQDQEALREHFYPNLEGGRYQSAPGEQIEDAQFEEIKS